MFLEAYATQALLRSPSFHRLVEKVAKNVHRVRHGLPPEEQGGTSIDRPGESGFSQHFMEEIKTQLGRAERKEQQNVMVKKDGRDGKEGLVGKEAEKEDAEAAWRDVQKSGQQPQGFMGEYMEALRSQIRDGKR
jgi:hypothetical protein